MYHSCDTFRSRQIIWTTTWNITIQKNIQFPQLWLLTKRKHFGTKKRIHFIHIKKIQICWVSFTFLPRILNSQWVKSNSIHPPFQWSKVVICHFVQKTLPPTRPRCAHENQDERMENSRNLMKYIFVQNVCFRLIFYGTLSIGVFECGFRYETWHTIPFRTALISMVKDIFCFVFILLEK